MRLKRGRKDYKLTGCKNGCLWSEKKCIYPPDAKLSPEEIVFVLDEFEHRRAEMLFNKYKLDRKTGTFKDKLYYSDNYFSFRGGVHVLGNAIYGTRFVTTEEVDNES